MEVLLLLEASKMCRIIMYNVCIRMKYIFTPSPDIVIVCLNFVKCIGLCKKIKNKKKIGFLSRAKLQNDSCLQDLRDPWDPTVCFNFLDKFLDFVKKSVTEDNHR